jgi:hypothetical protein
LCIFPDAKLARTSFFASELRMFALEKKDRFKIGMKEDPL